VNRWLTTLQRSDTDRVMTPLSEVQEQFERAARRLAPGDAADLVAGEGVARACRETGWV
jgi:hypothetical protein